MPGDSPRLVPGFMVWSFRRKDGGFNEFYRQRGFDTLPDHASFLDDEVSHFVCCPPLCCEIRRGFYRNQPRPCGNWLHARAKNLFPSLLCIGRRLITQPSRYYDHRTPALCGPRTGETLLLVFFDKHLLFMKKILALFGCVLFVWLGLGLALMTQMTESSSVQGIMCFLAAISICIGILFAGYGNSLPWKEKK